MSQPGFLQRLLDAWANGEHVISAANAVYEKATAAAAVEDYNIDDSEPLIAQLPEEVIFVTLCLCVVTTFYFAWHATTAVGKFFALLRDAVYFFIRLAIAVSLFCVIFLYMVPLEVRKEVHELCSAVVAAMSRGGWSYSVKNAFLHSVRNVFNVTTSE